MKMAVPRTTGNLTSQVALITGASSGCGKSIATHLARKGHRVYGTSRRGPSVDAADVPPNTDTAYPAMIRMDVRDDLSITQAIDLVMQREGRIDVLVNNAGFGLAGAVEDSSVEETKEQLETNFFGALRLCRAVLPHMRSQRYGRIINISSIGGLIGIPFQGAYSASKFALEGLTEALRIEVKPLGIHVSLVEPGDFKTDFTANRIRTSQSQTNPTYAGRFERALGVMEREEMSGPDPARIAVLLERIIEDPAPRLRYTVGPITQRIAVLGKRLLPGWLFEWLLRKNYRLQ